MRITRTLTTLAALVALVSLVGCGSEEAASTDDIADGTTLPADQDEAAVLDVCSLVTEAEVGALVGGAVTQEEQPGGGCAFNQEDPRATSLAFAVTPYDEGSGGFDGSAGGMTALFDGTDDQPVAGVGTEALVSVGTTMGGSNQQAGGLVHLGGSLVQVTLVQGTGLSADAVRTIAVDALKLVAGKA